MENAGNSQSEVNNNLEAGLVIRNSEQSSVMGN